MKKRNWILLLLIVLCLGLFQGYRMFRQAKTDTTPPKIIIPDGTAEGSILGSREALLTGVTATDDRDGDVTGSLLVEGMRLTGSDGTISVTYAAFDQSGNVAKATRSVHFSDYHSPRFQLDSPLLYPYGSRFDVLSTLGAQDLLDGDIQHRIRATAMEASSIDTLGVHPVQFQITNSLGDSVKYVFDVEVYSPSQYDAKLALKNYLVYLKVGDTFRPESYLSSFTYQNKDTNLQTRIPENFLLTTSAQVDTSAPGVYNLAYTLTYTDTSAASGSVRQHTAYSRLIVVVEE